MTEPSTVTSLYEQWLATNRVGRDDAKPHDAATPAMIGDRQTAPSRAAEAQRDDLHRQRHQGCRGIGQQTKKGA
jgi:hypothetical protein